MGVLVALVIVCGVGVYYSLDPVEYTGVMPWCPLRVMTGWNCPVCGLQRAMHAVLNGRVVEAVRYNWLLVPVAVYALVVVGAKVMRNLRLYDRLTSGTAVLIWCAVALVWCVVRNVIGC